MDTTIKSYEDLEVWKRGIEFALRTYDIVSHFPMEERFELSSQMRRAAVSIPSNVAEGHARRKPKPYLNHVHISLGSLAELVTCLIIARRSRTGSQSSGLSLCLGFVVGGLAGFLLL